MEETKHQRRMKSIHTSSYRTNYDQMILFKPTITVFSLPEAAREDPNFQCKSVMYYYNEGECILNDQTKESNTDAFVDEGESFLVGFLILKLSLREILFFHSLVIFNNFSKSREN